jgi:hypothetical protein
MEIINGKELGEFEAISVSVGVSKKENRDGKKSKFAVFQYQSTYSGGAKPVKDIIFEDDLGSRIFEALLNYRIDDGAGGYKKDDKGGYIIDIDGIFEAAAVDPSNRLKNRVEKQITNLYLLKPGGMVVPFTLEGERYANDVDGQPVLDRNGQRVKKKVIRVFVQVQNIYPGPDGKPVTQYVGGISPEVRGLELQDRFYKELVNKAVVPTSTKPEAPEATEAESETDPF